RTVGQRRVRWMPASYRAVHAFLTNPAYAGAFVFGRTAQKRELDEQGRVRRRTVQLPIEEWSVCLPEHHPGYVSWQEYLATRERLLQFAQAPAMLSLPLYGPDAPEAEAVDPPSVGSAAASRAEWRA